MPWRSDLKDITTPDVVPPSIADLCETVSRITSPIEPLAATMAEFNRSFQPMIESVAMMNRSFQPLAESVAKMHRSFAPVGQAIAEMNQSFYKTTFPATQALAATFRSEAFAGFVETMRSPAMLQLGETMREMAVVGAAFNSVINDSFGKEFRSVAETMRKVDWRAAIEESLEDTEDDQDGELKRVAETAGSLLSTELQSILDDVDQTPQGMIAALTAFRDRVVASPLGKATKAVVLWLLSVIISNLFWAYVCVPVGKSFHQHFSHREALKVTKKHVLRGGGYHPQLSIVSVESRLNIRMKPNRKSHVVGKLYPYDVVAVTGHAGKWARVCFANGQAEGWVFNKYLSRLKN